MTNPGRKIVAAISPETAIGFKLAGVEVIEVKDSGVLVDFLSDSSKSVDIGILITEERLLDKIPKDIVRRIKKRGVPVIVPIHIPDRWQKVERAEDYISNLIKSAIGYRLKIKA